MVQEFLAQRDHWKQQSKAGFCKSKKPLLQRLITTKQSLVLSNQASLNELVDLLGLKKLEF